MSQHFYIKTILSTVGIASSLAMHVNAAAPEVIKPSDKFDLSQWKITVPLDENRDGKVDEYDVRALQRYQHPDFFYVDADGYLVFTSPNQATTTAGSSNSRSELRQMLRGKSTKMDTKSPANNFAIAANKNAKKFASIGGKLEATLKVNQVALNAGHPNKPPAYSVVVGQIHAGKDDKLISQGKGFGWGNEPIKIYYKKWPNHKTGSVSWNYERNLEKDNPNRTDINYVVWGTKWDNPADPGDAGIPLGEDFSYTINVYQNIMDLTFENANKQTVRYQIDLSNNVDAYGKVDEKDNPKGYSGDWNYFKAGAYNQCSVKDAEGMWYTACGGTGDWKIDKANGDYTSVAFSRLVLSPATPPKPILPEERVPATAGTIATSNAEAQKMNVQPKVESHDMDAYPTTEDM